MRLEDRCQKEFDAVIRARGEDDFRASLVKMEQVSATSARFRIQDEDSAPVCGGGMDWSDAGRQGVLRASCSCRSFARGEFCQHLWAVVLEMDRRGTGAAFSAHPRVSLSRMPAGQTTAPVPRVETEASAKHPTPESSSNSGSAWKTLLFGGKSDREPNEALASRRALFFVDLERSRNEGQLVLELRYQEKLKSGEWGAVKTGKFDPFAIDEFDGDRDRELLGLLLSPLNTSKRASKNSDSSLEVDALLVRSVLPLLAASGRLFALPKASTTGDRNSLQDQAPLGEGEGEDEWDFEIDVKDDSNGFRLDGILRRGREKISLRDEARLAPLRSGFFVRSTSIERVEWGRHFELARHLCSHSILVPKDEEVDFVTGIASRSDLPTVNLPSALQWPLREIKPRALARFAKVPETEEDSVKNGAKYVFSPLVVYENLEIDITNSKKILLDPDQRVRVKRDMKSEKAFLGGLKGSFAPAKLKAEAISTKDIPDLVQRLQDGGWKVELDRQSVSELRETSGSLRRQGEDFVLEVDFDFEGVKIPLGSVFVACARGERIFTLSGNKCGFLPEDWSKRIGILMRGGAPEPRGGLRLKKASMPLFKPLFEDMPGLKVDGDVTGVFDGLVKLNAPGIAEKPKELKANLRSYQAEGLGWLETVAASGFGGILADDMGLGKTIQIISYLLRRATVPRSGPRPSLVVLPKSLVFNWLAEIERFGPKLRVLDFAGANRGMLKANDYDVVVTTYHILKNELDRFIKIEFDTLILDEAQAIKNPGSQVAQAVFQLKGVHRFALTGTPIENSLTDLFSLMRFANPGLIPSQLIASIGDGRNGDLSNDALERLSIALSPFILRRTKKQVLTELPDKTEQPLICELEGEQKKLYDRLRKHYREAVKNEIATKGTGGAKMQVLEALLRLRQVSCHPGLVDKGSVTKSSAKFAVLLEHLEEIRSAGHKALVFSQFTSLLGLLKPHLEKAGIRFEYLDGQTRDRGAVVDRFNSDASTTVFLISLKAGGTGLNLTTASYVFLLDPWWNPAIEAQAIDRAYRMGQKQKVMAYRLIAQGTIEEKIMRLQAQKRSLAEAVVSEDQSFLRSLSVADLEGLFE